MLGENVEKEHGHALAPASPTSPDCVRTLSVKAPLAKHRLINSPLIREIGLQLSANQVCSALPFFHGPFVGCKTLKCAASHCQCAPRLFSSTAVRELPNP